MRHRPEHKEDQPGQAEDQADKPESTFLRQRRDRRDRNSDLKHGDAARENFMLTKIGLGLRLLVFGFAFWGRESPLLRMLSEAPWSSLNVVPPCSRLAWKRAPL